MIFGLFLMLYGGVKFEKMVLITTIVISMILALIFLLSFLNFQLNGAGNAMVVSIAATVGVIIQVISKVYKKLKHIILGYFSITLGFNITATFYPDSPLASKAMLIYLLMFVLKVGMVFLFVIMRDYLTLLFNSFIGASFFVLSLGHLTKLIPNFLSMLEIVTEDPNELVS